MGTGQEADGTRSRGPVPWPRAALEGPAQGKRVRHSSLLVPEKTMGQEEVGATSAESTRGVNIRLSRHPAGQAHQGEKE